jgi:hypothetical protein
MGIISLPNLDAILQIKDPDQRFEALVNTVGILIKNMSEFNGHINSKNVFEVGGWRVNNTQLVSKDGDVGMSTEDTGSDDIRFWAGDAKDGSPNFKVTKAGILTAVDGVFEGEITAESGEIGGFTITETALTAISGGTIQNKSAAANKVYLNDTGFHANDSSGVERLTIGTAPAEGAKALIGRDASGTEQSVYTYDTETVDGSSRTGQFITAHGAVILISDDGDIRIMNSSGGGVRIVSGYPEVNDGFGWETVALQSDVATKATAGASTGSAGAIVLNGGIPIGTDLAISGGGSVTWSGISIPDHQHTQT